MALVCAPGTVRRTKDTTWDLEDGVWVEATDAPSCLSLAASLADWEIMGEGLCPRLGRLSSWANKDRSCPRDVAETRSKP